MTVFRPAEKAWLPTTDRCWHKGFVRFACTGIEGHFQKNMYLSVIDL